MGLVLCVCSAMTRSLFRFSWEPLGAWLRDRKKLTTVNSIKRERERARERERHYIMTKKLERIKYGPKSYKERERRRDCHLKILKIPPFNKIKF